MSTLKLAQFTGVNTWDDPLELHTPTRDNPTTELAVCRDFDITNNLKLVQRSGRTVVLSEAFTDLWNASGTILAVRDGWLCSIKSDFSGYTRLMSGFGAARVSYVNINNITVYSDRSNIGYVTGGVASAFPAPTSEFKQPLPAGQLVEYYKGRLLIAHSKTVSQSDPVAVRFTLDVNPASGGNRRQFASEVTLLKAVGGGIWLGDSGGIWWCPGDSLSAMERINKSPAKAFLGMAVKVKPETFSQPLQGIFFDVATDLGICRIGEDGYFHNLTTGKYNIPAAIKGCMAFLSRGKLNQTVAVFHQ